MSIQNILLQIIGTLIVLFGLREVFRDIFHPTRSGTLSEFVGRIMSLSCAERVCAQQSALFRWSPRSFAGSRRLL
jgi:hypothetical protein